MAYRCFSPLGANSPGLGGDAGADLARAGLDAAAAREGAFLRVPEVCRTDMPVPGIPAVAVRRPLELRVYRMPLPPKETLVLFAFSRTLTPGATLNDLLTRTPTAIPSLPGNTPPGRKPLLPCWNRDPFVLAAISEVRSGGPSRG